MPAVGLAILCGCAPGGTASASTQGGSSAREPARRTDGASDSIRVSPEGDTRIGPENDFDARALRVSFTVENPGATPIPWEASVSERWLSLPGPASGELAPGESVVLEVDVDPSGPAVAPRGVEEEPAVAHVRFLDRRTGSTAADRTVTIDSTYVDGGGWTVFTPSSDTRVVYVSSSAGDDGYNGLSPGNPKRTIAAGVALLRHGHPDWLLLNRGDTWQESLGYWKKSGRSRSEPMLVSTYGNALARPLLQTGSGGAIWTMPGGNSPPTIDDLAVVGLHFVANGFSGSGDCVGARILQPSSRFLIEDCKFEGYGTNLVFQAFANSGPARHHEFKLRRSIIADAHCVHGTGSHPQGLYALAVDGLLIEECVFDHNGWSETVPGAGADVFSHNIYIDNDNTDVVLRGNVISNASSHGLQLRCGGSVLNNLFVRNSISLLVGGGNSPNPGGVRADVRGNVILDGKNIDAVESRGWGMQIANIASGDISHNVMANNVLGLQPSVLSLEADPAINSGVGVGIHNLMIHHNTIYNWGGSVFVEGDLSHLSNIDLEHNDFQDLRGSLPIFEHFSTGSIGSVQAAGNSFFSRFLPSSGWTLICFIPHSMDYWMSQVGDTTSQVQLVRYVEPDRSVSSYNASLGAIASHDAFLAALRRQSRATWNPEYRALRVNRYLRRGFVAL